ncbi:PA domain-containing protein [Marinicella sp. W31]|uniref:PA domain-containing protein n=1 Tax=Marinicella sp. W31 TaxID=3023713 RepID=UPI0037572652
MKQLKKISIGLLSMAAALPLHAATLTIQIADSAGEGFNDPAVVAPIGGNTGTTLGEQRLQVFQEAADIWGALLNSNVTIVINAQFDPQTCSQQGAVLGSAGATNVFADFTNAPVANRWYSSALADSIADSDLNPGSADINATFNSALDTGCLNNGWYYGLDGATPAGFTPLLPVVLHEMGHGLGFQTFTSGSTGAFIQGRPDIWTDFMLDVETNETWSQMASNADRVASAINDPNLVWTGPNVTAEQGNFLGPLPQLVINAPASLAGNYPIQTASFGPPIPNNGLTGDIVLAEDNDTTGDVNDGCDTITTDLTGVIALVNRGACNFTVKVANAQAAGAIGVLVANNAPSGLPPMGGADGTITIPSAGITQALGQALSGVVLADVIFADGFDPLEVNNGTLEFDQNQFAGSNGGFVRLFAPDPFQGGSSVSHWTTDANPNLLMEPSITSTIFDEVDLTLYLYEDIGWSINEP